MTKKEKAIIKGIAEAVADYDCGEYSYFAIVTEIASVSGIRCDETEVMDILFDERGIE